MKERYSVFECDMWTASKLCKTFKTKKKAKKYIRKMTKGNVCDWDSSYFIKRIYIDK